jgi:alcohol dehydrogenase class IV
MTVPSFRHVTPAFRTFCGPDALAGLPRELDRLGVRRAVVFTDPAIAKHHPAALERVESALGDRLAGRFEDIQEHSPLPVVEAGRNALEDVGGEGVIAVGGGSAIVTARAATILLAENRDVRELCTRRDEDGRLVSPRLRAPKLPQWVVPSTPVTAYAKAGSAVRDPATGERLALFDPATRAQGIFFEPEMALTAPLRLAQASSLNAFSMAVEGLQSSVDDPLAEALLAHASRILAEWLPRLADGPDDPEPRLRLMLGALLCGQGSDFAGGGLAQALSHAAGPRSNASNGVVEAMLLPYTMRYNEPVTGPRFPRIVDALDARPVVSASPGEGAIPAVSNFLRGVGVPERLRDVGIAQDAIPEVVAHAIDDWSLTLVPRPAGPDELKELLEAAW